LRNFHCGKQHWPEVAIRNEQLVCFQQPLRQGGWNSDFSIYDARRSKSSIYDKDLLHFHAFAEMRRCAVVFFKNMRNMTRFCQ